MESHLIKKIFYKTFEANENQLKAKFYEFLQPPAFTAVTSDQKVHFIKIFKVFESQMKAKFYNFLQRSPSHGVISNQKIQI